MVRILGFVLISTLLAGCAAPDRKPKSLIKGTLSNWEQRGGRASYAIEHAAEGDIIIGATRPQQPNSFLCTTATYRNFLLELDFLVDPALNSGIQIRSESKPEYKNGVVHGYQVEIDPSARAWTGGIYDESRRGWLAPLDKNPDAKRAFKQGQWNHLKILARGDHIQTWLNGVPAADLHDSMTPEGFIALQVHGVGDRKEELTIRWRRMEITRLD